MSNLEPTKINFRCSQAEKEAWEAEASARGLSLSQLIRLGLGELLVENSTRGGDEAPVARPSQRQKPAASASDDDVIPFSRTCRLAAHHWMIVAGDSCPACGGVQR